MGPKELEDLQQNILKLIPKQGIFLSKIIKEFAIDENNYERTDVKVAVLCLKTEGKVKIDDHSIVCKIKIKILL